MPDLVELKQIDSMWVISFNGNTMACSLGRAGAINAGAGLLRRILADPATRSAMSFSGLELHELLPVLPPGRGPQHLPSKIDFAGAKQLIREKFLPVAEKRVGTAVEIVDELCVEYEWGWEIHWRPIDPSKGDPQFVNEYHFPYLADRVTGELGFTGTKSIQYWIINLLQWREPELCGPYPPGKQGWQIVLKAFEDAGAFTPIASPPSSVSGDVADSRDSTVMRYSES